MNEMLTSDKKNIWHPFTPLTGTSDPILIKSAKGTKLITHDNQEIIDAVSSWWVNIHGHAHPKIAQAIYEQALNLEHVIFAGFTHEPAVKLSQNLLSILPSNQVKIFFSDNGSTAVEVALKMAIQYWFNQSILKPNIIVIDGAYHGDTFGSMSIGERGMFTDPFKKYLFNTLTIPFPAASEEDAVFKQFADYVNQGDVGAFIFEPLVQGAAGMRMYSATFLDKLIEYAQSKEVICIADEVFTGFGRTGKLFASNYLQHKPDIIAVSKGITGGTMPLGVTACSQRIVNAYLSDDFSKTFFHGHSYTANPIACAAANASFELLMNDACQQQIQFIASAHSNYLAKLQRHGKIKEARALGTILALEIKTQDETSYSNSLRKSIYPFFLNKGILLRPLGNVIYVLPPYVITQNELQYVYDSINEFLETL